MPATPSNWELAREWLTLGFVGLSAAFAGLIWWLARSGLSNRFEARVLTQNAGKGRLFLKVIIANRSNKNLTIEALSVTGPWSILTNDRGDFYTAVNARVLDEARKAKQVDYSPVIPPDKPLSFVVALEREGGLNSCKRVSIRVHILKSFPTIRHKKKRLTAILPASMRNAQPSNEVI